MMSFTDALACQHIYVLKFRQPINLKLKFANNYAKVNRALKSNTSKIIVTNTIGINQNANCKCNILVSQKKKGTILNKVLGHLEQ